MCVLIMFFIFCLLHCFDILRALQEQDKTTPPKASQFLRDSKEPSRQHSFHRQTNPPDSILLNTVLNLVLALQANVSPALIIPGQDHQPPRDHLYSWDDSN